MHFKVKCEKNILIWLDNCLYKQERFRAYFEWWEGTSGEMDILIWISKLHAFESK